MSSDVQAARSRLSAHGEQVTDLAYTDDFQRALDLERQALLTAVADTSPAMCERLQPLVSELYAIMRTPIFPRRGHQTVADALLATAHAASNAVQLYGVLASPTAQDELSIFLACASIFERHGFVPRVELLHVQWENLVEISQQAANCRAQLFDEQTRLMVQIAQRSGLSVSVASITVEVDYATGTILAPSDFRAWFDEVRGAVQLPRKAHPDVARDVAWSTAFYARQVSLSRLGPQQALLDLAIRRAVGARISTMCMSCPQDQMVAMMTSELHKRFLPCYAANLPIINIDARRLGRGALALAVA